MTTTTTKKKTKAATIKWEDMTPSKLRWGTIVEFTDGLGRKSTLWVKNVWPGMVVGTVMSCDGVSRDSLVSWSLFSLRWPDRQFYTPEEIREGARA